MELLFLLLLLVSMALALGSGYPVAFALPGASIFTIVVAAVVGYFLAGDVDAYFLQDGPSQWLSAGVTNLRGVYWEVERDTLIAIPLFIFMGIMLQRSKVAEDLLLTMAQLFGTIPGGLGISVVFVGALLAATTGIVGATVVAMGLISLPAMLRNNYSPALATGTIAASGTLGQIIPPSIVLIILADQLASAADQASTIRKELYKDATGDFQMPTTFDVISTSAGEMFLGALIPGLMLVGIYMVYILVYAFLRPKAAPPVKREGVLDAQFFFKLALALVPPLTLIFLVLGSILTGVATVNQAGAIGAAGALLMSSYRLHEGKRFAFGPSIIALLSLVAIALVVRAYDTSIKGDAFIENQKGILIAVVASATLLLALGWSAVRAYRTGGILGSVMVETAKATCLVFIILLGAAMLTAAFRAFGGEELVRDFLNGLPGGFWAKFAMVMLVIFLLGFFLDFIEIAVVVVPIVAPILLADPSANITAVWLGVMIGLNIQTSFLTPPFGFALFYLRGVAPAIVRTVDMYKGVIPFIGLQLLALLIVANFPALVNYLPNRVSYLSETAPPPRNPRLQMCLEDYVVDRLAQAPGAFRAQLDAAGQIDLSAVPEELTEDFNEGLERAREALALLDEIDVNEAAAQAAAPDYRPLHDEVRRIQADMRDIQAVIDARKTTASRLRGEENAERKQALLDTVEQLQAEREALGETIPAEWADIQSAYVTLDKATERSRMQFQRASDDAWSALSPVTERVGGVERFAEVGEQLARVRERLLLVGDEENAAALTIAAIAATESRLQELVGGDEVASLVGDIRRALDAEEPDAAAAGEALDQADAAFAAELQWRRSIDAQSAATLAELSVTLKDTLGIRSQRNMTREQALYVASCGSHHTDISLSF